MKKGDIVQRVKNDPGENRSAWRHLSINTDYKIEHVLDSGTNKGKLVLEYFLMLVGTDEVELNESR